MAEEKRERGKMNLWEGRKERRRAEEGKMEREERGGMEEREGGLLREKERNVERK